MRFVFFVVALTLGATVKARPGGTGDYGLEGNGNVQEGTANVLGWDVSDKRGPEEYW